MHIVGAGRSGTKLLRAVLGRHSALEYFPREINYIWRYGNRGYPTDELRPEHATPKTIKYIRRRFDRFAAAHGNRTVVEKTCANALRVDFVRAIFPEARIIHLVRDGRAVAESARREWLIPQNPKGLWEKGRWVPLRDVPYYAWRYLRDQSGRLELQDKRPFAWGPRFDGLETCVRERSLIEVCAIQWCVCAQAAHASLTHVPPHQARQVRYEDFVTQPAEVLGSLFEWLGIPLPRDTVVEMCRDIESRHLEKWRRLVPPDELLLIDQHISETLDMFGYA